MLCFPYENELVLNLKNPGGENFSHSSRLALGPTQVPVHWVPGLCRGAKGSQGVKPTPHPLLVPWPRKSRYKPLLPYGSNVLYRASVPVKYNGAIYFFYFLIYIYIYIYIPKSWDQTIAYITAKNKYDHQIFSSTIIRERKCFISY